MKTQSLATRVLGSTVLFFSILVVSAHPLSENLTGLSINMRIIKTIESDANPAAFNARTKCYGLYQISEICLEYFNQAHGSHYTCGDLFDPEINEMIARWYFKRLTQLLMHYNVPLTLTHLIASYNWGIGNVVAWHRSGTDFRALPSETQRYVNRYVTLARAF